MKAGDNLASMAMYVQQDYYIQGFPTILQRYFSIVPFSNGEITDRHRKRQRSESQSVAR